MKKKICFFFAFIFLSISLVFAEGEKNIEYGFIAFTFKNIAKAYISVVDLAKLKKDNIRVLKAQDETTYRKGYTRVLKGIKELPPEYRVKYGIKDNMDRNEVIKMINSCNKKRLYAMIDDLPQEFIGKYFQEYMQKHKQKTAGKDMLLNVKDFWERIVQSPQHVARQDIRNNN